MAVGQAPNAPPANQLASVMSTYGAVPVGGRNFFKLLEAGEAVMLFPGGVREVCRTESANMLDRELLPRVQFLSRANGVFKRRTRAGV